MSLAERLAFLIDVDGQGAVRGFQQVGRSAERELGKADDRLDRIGSRLSVAGAGALAFAGVAGGALVSFARAAEESNRSSLLLDNTLQNMPKLAGENADQFKDLADAIQGKTAADGDQIVSAMAMLGTFSLTADEIKGATPLVVDYAQKFGIDLVSAATQVGKALDGQIGALKKNGVSIDENTYKTDRYAAVTEALRDQVGGFAEQEGATFSGRMQRLKNELGDVQEGLGVGVVGAFEDALGPVTALSDKFSDLSPESQALAGRFLAIGTAGIGAVGGLSLVAGQLIKLRDRFTEVDVTGTRTLTTMGKFATGLGVAAGIVGIATALYELDQATSGVKIHMDELSKTTSDQLAKDFLELREVISEGKWLDVFGHIAENNIGTAQRLRDALAAQGVEVRALDTILKEETAAQRQATQDAQVAAETTAEVADETRTLADVVSEATDRLKEYDTQLDETLGASLNVRDAHRETAEAVEALTAVVEEGREKDETAAQFTRRRQAALDDLVGSILDEVDAMAESGEIADTVASRNDTLRYKLEALKGQYPDLADEIDGFVHAAEDAAAKTGPAGEKAATDFIDGVLRILRGRNGEVYGAADSIGRQIEAGTRDALEEKSPSKVGERIGEDFTKGIGNGISSGSHDVVSYVDALVDNVIDAADEMRSRNQAGRNLADIDAEVAALYNERSDLPRRLEVVRNRRERAHEEMRVAEYMNDPARYERAKQDSEEAGRRTRELLDRRDEIDEDIRRLMERRTDAQFDLIDTSGQPITLSQAEQDAFRWRAGEVGITRQDIDALLAAVNALGARPIEVHLDGEQITAKVIERTSKFARNNNLRFLTPA